MNLPKTALTKTFVLTLALLTLSVTFSAPTQAAPTANARIGGFATTPQIDLGANFACALQATGTIDCWGDNLYGQLGNSTNDNSLTPVSVTGIETAIAVSVGVSYACALLADGTVECWGDNADGQLGNGTNDPTNTPTPVVGISNATSIATGGFHACATLADGTARCWGRNAEGQLGDGSSDETNTPVAVLALTTAISIEAGHFHTCALLGDTTLACWGLNDVGQLGIGTFSSGTDTPIILTEIDSAKAIGLGFKHTCAVVTSGVTQCWGSNQFGQIGDGTNDNRNEPTTINTPPATSLAIGFYHSCNRTASGEVFCWGNNANGELGNGTDGNTYTQPHPVSNITTAASIGAGSGGTCALLGNGQLQCWGANTNGMLGTGNTTPQSEPVSTLFLPEIAPIALALGQFHACAVFSNGNVRCWGKNDESQLGFTGSDQNEPTDVANLTDIVAIALGELHTCALNASGVVKCWGNNNFGQLGIGEPPGTFDSPTETVNLSAVIALTAGYFHSCGVLGDGTAKCWGAGFNGQLGNNQNGTYNSPQDVVNLEEAFAITAGFGHTCALSAGGQVACWGLNADGQLGNEDMPNNTSTPAQVAGIPGVVNLVAGSYHTCALMGNGSGYCWGENTTGQLGNSASLPGASQEGPVAITGLTGAYGLSAGFNHTCGWLATGIAQCWGANFSGQLGDNNPPTGSSVPVAVNNIAQVTAMAAGNSFTCAIAENIHIYCWGINFNGQIGNGTTGGTFAQPEMVINLLPIYPIFLPILLR